MAPAKSIHVGVFLPSPIDVPVGPQLLDTACVDIFGVIDRQYLEILQVHLPAPEWRLSDPAALDLAPSVRISYIGAGPAGALLNLTSGLTLRLTHHYSDADVAPGKLDVVLVPGANPFEEWEEAALAWLKAQAEFNGGSTDILSVCTGMYICGKAGLLSKPGRKACGPRALQDDLASRFEGVEWVGREKRWVQDGNFWSCGGVTNGNDLVAAYLRTSDRFDQRLVELALSIAEVGDRPLLYSDKR